LPDGVAQLLHVAADSPMGGLLLGHAAESLGDPVRVIGRTDVSSALPADRE